MRVTKLLFLICLMGMVSTATAVDSPHDPTNNIYCGQCHITHATQGDILINATDSLVSTLCISCHTPGGWIPMAKAISGSMKADPSGGTGSSHAWDVDTASVTYGATTPSSQVLLDHLRADGKITCSTCHDPHENTTSPFLRLDNTANALCLDCHSSRSHNVDSIRTYTGTPRSHPVMSALPATSTYHNPPLDADGSPQPSDGNTTNDFALGGSNEIYCTSCHGVHYTDSNSGTVDGP